MLLDLHFSGRLLQFQFFFELFVTFIVESEKLMKFLEIWEKIHQNRTNSSWDIVFQSEKTIKKFILIVKYNIKYSYPIL